MFLINHQNTFYKFLSVFVVLLGIMVFGSCHANEATNNSEVISDISKDDLSSLLETLENDEKKEKLVNNIKTLINLEEERSSKNTGQYVGIVDSKLLVISQNIQDLVEIFAKLPETVDKYYALLQIQENRNEFLKLIVKLSLILAAAILGEQIFHYFLRKPRQVLESKKQDKAVLKTFSLFNRTLIDILPIFVFAAICYSLLPVIKTGDLVRQIIIAFIQANILVRVIKSFGLMLFTPKASNLRLTPFSDQQANYFYVWLRRLTVLVIYGWLLTQILIFVGAPEVIYKLCIKSLGLIILSFVIIFISQNKESVANYLQSLPIKSSSSISLLKRFSKIWHILAIAYVILMYCFWSFGIEGGFEKAFEASLMTAIIFIIAQLINKGLTKVIQNLFNLRDDVKKKFPTLESRANKYLSVFLKIKTVLITILAIIFILDAWGIDIFALLSTNIGKSIIQSLVTIGFVLIITFMIWEVINAWVDRQMESRTSPEDARARTLLPLLRNAVLVILCLASSFIILSELSIDIAPLLAGAGVIGLAIGFGAQTLVKDIITGIFILIENTIEVGDVVELAGHHGVVQGMSIRTIRLRDVGGCVHTVPFSEVTTIMNHTKDFSYALFEIGVAYKENIDFVVNTILEVAKELEKDDDIKEYLLEPMEMLGLDQFGDSAIIIKARIKTIALKQWRVKRAFNRLLKIRFDKENIEIPFPHMTVYMGDTPEIESPKTAKKSK